MKCPRETFLHLVAGAAAILGLTSPAAAQSGGF